MSAKEALGTTHDQQEPPHDSSVPKTERRRHHGSAEEQTPVRFYSTDDSSTDSLPLPLVCLLLPPLSDFWTGTKPPPSLDHAHTDYLPLHGTLTGNLNILRRGSSKPTSPVLRPHPPTQLLRIQEMQTQYKDNPGQTEKETGPVTLLGK